VSERKYWQAVNDALREEMSRDERVCVFGEDVAEPGGPFGATRGLLAEFGTDRVRDTPICEATIVGAALGAAMTGLRPVVEVMFMDFMTLAMDQLVNQAAKIGYMSAGKYSAPMVVRMLCGSNRGTGPQHGQNLEAWLAHVPGLTVAWPTNPWDAKAVLKAAIRYDGPVVVIESLELWSRRGEVGDADTVAPLGQAQVRRRGSDVTIVSWGGAVRAAAEATQTLSDNRINAELVELVTVNPIDHACVAESVSRTGRLAVVQNSVAPVSVGSEVAAIAASVTVLKQPVIRVSAPFAPVPFPAHLEAEYFPQAERVARTIKDAVSGEVAT
jgi:acetoin:2,6-dichlorophenolindophenol oxidoreductase subunit beta